MYNFLRSQSSDIRRSKRYICIPITFSNPLKVCFAYKKYTITTKTRPTQIVKVSFLLKNRVLTNFLRLLVYKFTYLSLFVQISSITIHQWLEIRPHTHEFLTINILLHIKSEQKVIRK